MRQTMCGVVLAGHGGMEMLQWQENLPVPVPGDDDVLIRVAACGLNNTDVNTRIGWYAKSGQIGSGDETWGGAPLTFPRIQGADIVGHVTAAGNNVPETLVGKRVMVDPWLRDEMNIDRMDHARFLGSECDGGFAEYVCVPFTAVHPVNSNLLDEELATFATSWVTAENMLDRASVDASDTVLVTGASGGVGSALVQLANRRGASTIALTSTEMIEAVRSLGATAVVDRHATGLLGIIEGLTGPAGITVAADVVGGQMWPDIIALIAHGGRYVCSGAVAGHDVNFDLRAFYLKDLSFYGATVVPKGTFANLVGYIERNEIRPLLAAVYPLRQIREAQARFLAREHLGNIVVKP